MAAGAGNARLAGRRSPSAARWQLSMAAPALALDCSGRAQAVHSVAGSTMRRAHSSFGKHQLAVLAGGILLLDAGIAFPGVTRSAKRGHFVGCSNPVRFRLTLRGSVLDALSVAGVTVQPLFGMRVRQKVLHCLTVTYFAIVASLLLPIREAAANNEQQNCSDPVHRPSITAFGNHAQSTPTLNPRQG